MTGLHELSAREAGAAVAAGDVSSAELVDAALERAQGVGAAVGAFVHLDAQGARAAARAADAQVAAARRDGDGAAGLGPLHGVPTAVKDLHAVAGQPLRLGSLVTEGLVPAHDDHVVSLMRAAGLVSLGKTTTPELGLPCYTEPDVGPTARTPWDLARSAGGSSGGAAAAVAAGVVPVAQASDGGGSIRIPASVCGLVGLKPTRGRVSTGPLVPTWSGLLHLGAVTRTVRDTAAFLDAVSAPQVGDPTWAPPPAEPFLRTCDRPVGRLRLGRYAIPVLADTTVHADVLAAFERTSSLLEDLGHDVVDVDPPFGPDVLATFSVLWSVGALAVPVPEEDEPRLRPLTRWLRERGRSHSGAALAAALSAVQVSARRAVAATAHLDAVLLPTLAQPPVAVGALRDDDDPAGDFAAQAAFTPFTAAYNVTGQPVVSLPLETTPGGLPVGMALAGRPADEATLLRLAVQLEDARPWRDRRPPVW